MTASSTGYYRDAYTLTPKSAIALKQDIFSILLSLTKH